MRKVIERVAWSAGAALLLAGCSEGGTGPLPDEDGNHLADQFHRLADSVDAGGYSPAANALRHAAEIVRLTGHATPVTVTIDGGARSYLAVAEQIDFPNLVCGWPADSGVASPPDTIGLAPPDTAGMPPIPPDSGGIPPMPPDTVHVPVDSGTIQPPECHTEGTNSMRTLIAWEPERMAEVVRIVAWIGSSEVNPNVPDVMTGLPGGTADPSAPAAPPDSGSGTGGQPGGFPGFMGEYLVRDVGSWYATAGEQRNDLLQSGGDCTAPRATIDWAEFECQTARLRLEFSMGVDPPSYEPLTGAASPPDGPRGHHAISMGASEVDGVRLTFISGRSKAESAE